MQGVHDGNIDLRQGRKGGQERVNSKSEIQRTPDTHLYTIFINTIHIMPYLPELRTKKQRHARKLTSRNLRL